MPEREQRVHDKASPYPNMLAKWLDTLISETDEDETPIHQIQQFQIVPENDRSGYWGIVLCNHLKK
jgi:hypothetical protein